MESGKSKTIRILLSIAAIYVALTLAGCAASYKRIRPPTLEYPFHTLHDSILIAYRYDVLNSHGNKKVAQKADERGIKVIAIEITNLNDSVLHIGDDLVFYSGSKQVYPIETKRLKNEIRQFAPGYLAYLLMIPIKFNLGVGQNISTFDLGYLLGPVLALYNVLTAATANTNMMGELEGYNIMNKTIGKDEKVQGLIGIRDFDFNPIVVMLKGNSPVKQNLSNTAGVAE
jgi:hypothetical protein